MSHQQADEEAAPPSATRRNRYVLMNRPHPKVLELKVLFLHGFFKH
jgi:hypothetical protein